MNNERLLSENEITLIVGWPSAFEYAKIIEITTAQDRKSIAARDKWWRGLLQEVNEANDLKDLQERFAHLLRYTADLDVKQ